MEKALSAYKALGDKNRLRIIAALKKGELCACQIIALLGVSGATVSQHLGLLVQAGLCRSRKEGRWVYYSLSESPFLPNFALMEGGEFQKDAENLQRILAVPAEELCRLQREGCCNII